jgi:CheY-like chemotaxis protein
LDLIMPELSGLETYRQLHTQDPSVVRHTDCNL